MLIRTYIENTIPATLFEAAKVDGAKELLIYVQIVFPLGKPILVTMGLFSGLNYWNNWNNGLYYRTDPKWYSIQNFLNKMITDAQFLLNNADFTGGAVVDIPTTSIRMAIASGISVFTKIFCERDCLSWRRRESVNKIGAA